MKLRQTLLCLIGFSLSGNLLSQYFETVDSQAGTQFQYQLKTPVCDYYFSETGIAAVVKKHNQDSSVVKMRYDMTFQSSLKAEFVPMDKQAFRKTHIRGHHIEEVTSYQSLLLKNVWNGVDIQFDVSENGDLKYDFHVNGRLGNHEDIAINYEGLANGYVDHNSLVFESKMGRISQQFPLVYLIGDNEKDDVPDFQLNFEDNTLSFQLGDYDRSRTLVIDPWCTYFGGGDIDEAYGVAVDDLGNSVIIGYTYSVDLPVTVGTIDTSYEIDYDAYIAKFDSTGDLLWATYYGGNGGDYGRKVKLDANNNIYATGNTTSTNLMTSPGAYQPANAGSYDAYLLKISPNGAFIWSTLFGGTGGDFGMVEDVHNDRVVIAGFSSSMDLPVNGFQDTLAGALDSYIAVFDTSGAYQWSTYFGGTNSEDIHAITFDNAGNIIAVGDSYSVDLPVTAGAHQMNNNGTMDIYIIKTTGTGTRVFATYFGGYSNDDALSVCTDEDNRIYFSGYSKSNDFPIVTGAYQSSLNSAKDGMFARFSPNGMLEYSTFFGGDDNEEFTGMTYENGKIYMVMNSRSGDLILHGTPYQASSNGYSENYIMVLDTGLNIAYSTYFGGVSSEMSYEIDVTPDEAVYVSGFSSGSDLAFGNGVFQNSPVGSTDAYVLRLDDLIGIFNNLSDAPKEPILMYPNPTADQLRIRSESTIFNKFEIYNSVGQLLIQNEPSSQTDKSIDVSALPSGRYLLKAISENQTKTISFIKL